VLQEVMTSLPLIYFVSTQADNIQFTMTTGQHAGLKAWVALPATHFPFERLPIELRQRIYKLLFPPQDIVSLDSLTIRRDYIRQDQKFRSRKTAILRVNRAINAEVIGFLYHPSHFVSSAMGMLNDWLDNIGSSRQHLRRLTISKSGVNIIGNCYRLLADAVSLQFFEITLPSAARTTLDEHMERHWEGLKLYLLAHGIDRKESLRRLGVVHFKIGPSQNCILTAAGDAMREMTQERQESCRTKFRGKILDHFMRKAVKQIAAKSDTKAERTAHWAQQQIFSEGR
jgi:hypothetical protein